MTVRGQGLDVTAMSYRDRIGLGLLASPTLVPDVEMLAGWIGAELTELTRLTDLSAQAAGRPAR